MSCTIEPTVKTTIKSINLVSSWNYIGNPTAEIVDENCGICNRSLVAPPLQELQSDKKTIIIEGNLVKGVCGDIFHEKCMASQYITNDKCNNCNMVWQQVKILKSDVICGNASNLTIKKKTTSEKISG